MKKFESVVNNSEEENKKILTIIDLSAFSSWRHFDVHFGRTMARTLCDNFPERLGLFVVWNAPKVIGALWSPVKLFLDNDTKQRFKWTNEIDEMTQIIDMDHISKTMGGREDYIPATEFIIDTE